MSSHIIGPFPKKKVSPSEKVTLSEEVEKGTIFLDDMDNTKFKEKLDLTMNNYSVTLKKRTKTSDDLDYEETTKYSESSSDKKEEEKEKLVAKFSVK